MNLIIAVDKNWGIGKDGGLLCHIPGDLEYFKKMTLDKTVIMGRVTLESLPGSKGLPRRRNIVLTRDTSFDADRHFENLDASGEFDCEPVGELMEEKGIEYRSYKYTRKSTRKR